MTSSLTYNQIMSQYYEWLENRRKQAFKKIPEVLQERIEEYIKGISEDGYAPCDYEIVNYFNGDKQQELGMDIYIDQYQFSDDGFAGNVFIPIGDGVRYLRLEY